MGGITTGVGLFSGIDTQSLIGQLLAIDARPQILAQNRIAQLQQQQSAFLGINSTLNALRTSSRAFEQDDVFIRNTTTSSNPSVLTATAGVNAPEGSFQFVVNRLVSTQQQLSRGFNDLDTSAVGANEFTFEDVRGSVRRETDLVELNGGNGIDRGEFSITQDGETVDIDLSTAVTVTDVLNAINNNGNLNLNARVVGDRFVLESTDGTDFSVEDGQSNSTASSLGIAGESVDVGGVQVLSGNDIRSVSELTPLAILNDGEGIQTSGFRLLNADDTQSGTATFDITIKDRANNQINISLGETLQIVNDEDGNPTSERTVVQPAVSTLGDVINRINEAIQAQADAGGQVVDVVAGLNADGTGLGFEDTSGSTTFKLVVTNVFTADNSIDTADQFGINTTNGGVASNTFDGDRLLSGLNSIFLDTLNGGSGISQANLTGTALSITARNNSTFNVNLSGFNERSSLTEVIEQINADAETAGVSVRAELNRTGNGIALVDSTGGSNDLVVAGDAAAEFGLETAGTAGARVEGGNLQAQYIYGTTRLEDLNLTEALAAGTIRLTDASGGIDTLSFTASGGNLVFNGNTLETVDDLINIIRSRPNTDVTIGINANGDGLEFTDTSGGAGQLTIEDVSGNLARDLGFEGTSEDDGSGNQILDGSLETRVEFDAGATLQDVIDSINAAGVGVRATVVNNGGSFNPFAINFTSRDSGADGRVLIDTQGFDLGLSQLSRGQDAVAFFGSEDPADGILLTSSTNTLDNVIEGLSIDLRSTSTEAVTVSVTRDTEGIEGQVQDFVDAFNAALDQIDSLDFFDVENEQRGVLLGDPTLAAIRRQLYSTIQGTPQGVDGQFTRLFQVGVGIGEGARLEFDRDEFRSALEQSPENVEQLFSARDLIPREPIQVLPDNPGITVANTGNDTFSSLGVAELIGELVNGFTNTIDGLLTNRGNAIDQQIAVQENRIDSLQIRLDDRRQQLERQFLVLEQSLASLSSQQSALAQFG